MRGGSHQPAPIPSHSAHVLRHYLPLRLLVVLYLATNETSQNF